MFSTSQGIIGAVAGLLTGKVSKYYNDPQFELFHGSLIQAASFLAITFAPNVAFMIALLIPLSISGTIIHTSTSNILIQRSPPSKVITFRKSPSLSSVFSFHL